MLTVPRWSLRLPRAATDAVLPRVPRRTLPLRCINPQRRWLQVTSPRPLPPTPSPRPPENGHGANIPNRTPVKEPQNEGSEEEGKNAQLSRMLAESDSSDLVAPVTIPDDPHGVLPPDHPALSILGNSSLVIQRQIEMMNLIVGFEQANRYVVMDGKGQTLGYIAEQDHGMGQAMVRQMARTHRSFTTHIFDAQEREVLRIHRPFAYINSRIRIYDAIPESGYEDVPVEDSPSSSAQPSARTSPLKLEEMRIIGEAQQEWAAMRRKYNLYSHRPFSPVPSSFQSNTDPTTTTENTTSEAAIEAGMVQFAHIDEQMLSFDFTLRDEQQGTIGSVNRDFSGFAREIFTDTGVYALRMDSAALLARPATDGEGLPPSAAMSLDQRAVMLATAISIDFDYFSRHSSHFGGMPIPLWLPMGGGGAAEAGAAGAAGAGAAGAAEGAAGIGAAAAGRGIAGAGATAGEIGASGVAGAGTMAGYEAMQRGAYGSRGQTDDASPQAAEPPPGDGSSPQSWEQAQNQPGQDDVWGADQDPWSDKATGAGAEGGGEGGGGLLDAISDFFFGP